MTFTLPELPYKMDALAPHVSEETLNYHYGKHHATYVTNLNNLTKDSEFADMPLEDVIKKSSGGVYNNAAQIWNHSFYWNCLSPNGGGAPSGALADAINRDFGSFASFQEKFNLAAKTLFGSGWVFLCQTKDGKLEITQEGAAGNPMTSGMTPVMTLDVWEHAYYIDYRNARPAYIDAFWNLVNWEFVATNLG